MPSPCSRPYREPARAARLTRRLEATPVAPDQPSRRRGHRRPDVGLTLVAAVDYSAEIRDLRTTVDSIQQVSDLGRLRAEIAELEKASAAPDLWDDPEAAQKVTSRLSHLNAELERVERVGQRVDDLEVLVELAQDEDDAETLAEAEAELH